MLLLGCNSAKNQSEEDQKNTLSEPQSTPANIENDAQNNDEDSSVPRIVFFGNSLSAGYGLENPALAFPGLIQQKLNAEGYDYNVVNAGLSGETTAGGRNRIDWVLKQPVSVLVLELGGNDGLRGIPTEESLDNLQLIIETTQQKYPDATVILAGMEAPPNMGDDYTQSFREIYTTLAEKNELPIIPFLLEGVAGESSLNLPDGIHPNPEGHKIVAENVWAVLQPVLEAKTTESDPS